jgi:hypothetical protein
LNITIDPPALDNDDDDEIPDSASLGIHDGIEIERNDLFPINSNISEESSESYDNDTHIASWIEGSLIGSSVFNKEDDDDNEDNSSNDS